jgi:multiple sugar transport system substrate-binding protein
VYSFKLRKELEQAKAIIPLAELKATKTHYSKAFWAGNSGMLLIGAWFPGMMLSAREEGSLQGFTWEDWGLTRLPCDEPEYRTPGLPTSNVVHADSEKKDAAFTFVSWMAGPEGAKVVMQNGFMPAMFTEDVKEVAASALPDESSLKYYTEDTMHVTGWYSKYGTKVETELVKVLEEYLMSDMTDNQLMDTIKTRFEEIINTTM